MVYSLTNKQYNQINKGSFPIETSGTILVGIGGIGVASTVRGTALAKAMGAESATDSASILFSEFYSQVRTAVEPILPSATSTYTPVYVVAPTPGSLLVPVPLRSFTM